MIMIKLVIIVNCSLMLKISVPTCLLVAVSLSAGLFGATSTSSSAFFAFCFVFGLSIAWQFGSMYLWLAKHIDLVVSKANY